MSTEHATGAVPGGLTAAMASLYIVNGLIRGSFLCLYLALPRYPSTFFMASNSKILHSSENQALDYHL